MKLNVYCIYDVKAGIFNKPFFMTKDAMAVRSFSDIVNDDRSSICSHPEDYTLHRIGSYDDGTGVLEAGKIVSIANAGALKRFNDSPPLPEKLVDGLRKAGVS